MSKSWSFSEFFGNVLDDARKKGIPVDKMINPEAVNVAQVSFRDDLTKEEKARRGIFNNPNRFINVADDGDGYGGYQILRNEAEVIIVHPDTGERFWSYSANLNAGNGHGDHFPGEGDPMDFQEYIDRCYDALAGCDPYNPSSRDNSIFSTESQSGYDANGFPVRGSNIDPGKSLL